MKYVLLLLILTGFINQLSAQKLRKCQTPYIDSIEVAKDPTILERRAELESFTKQYQQQNYKSYDKLVIPIVFHVLHQYGQERLSMTQIEQGIENLNKDYSAQNSDLNQTIADFYGIIGNMNVEFRLAKIDPDGNPTTGVIYYDTELAYKASNSLKYTIRNWNPKRYLNIWTVASIEGNAAAWSHYPGVESALDGVVTIYTYVYQTHTLAHEIGHFLNLIHPWGSTNEPGLASNCNIDDNVEDTPNTIGSNQTCILDQVTCGSLDNVQNIMDYSTCDCMFTQGQIDRMRAALNSSIGSRNQLWIQSTLVATGTNDGYIEREIIPVADFSSYKKSICPGATVDFDCYTNGGEPLSWYWEFEGGTPATSTEKNPTVTYNQPGVYKVKLTTTNDAGSNSLERTDIITVNDIENGFTAPLTIDLEDASTPFYGDIPAKTWYTENSENGNWGWYSSSTNKAFRINNSVNNEGTVNSLVSPSINMSKVVPPDYIYFDWAYAQKTASSADVLKVFVSVDCGETWILRMSKTAKSLATNGGSYVTSEFIPTSDQWKTGKLDITSFKNASHLEVKFAVESRKGNYLYIDNLKVEGTTNINETSTQQQWMQIYPNPAKEFTIEYHLTNAQAVNLTICNSIGKTLTTITREGISGSNKAKLVPSDFNLPTGVYFLTLTCPEYSCSKKILVY